MERIRKRAVTVAALALTGIGLALWSGVGRPEAAHGQASGSAGGALGITVNGVGTVTAKPDEAEFTFGVETQGQTADEALAKNSVAVQKVIDAVKGAGVAASDIQTQQVSVYPRYSDNGQAIVGFTATNSVTAKIRDVSKAGAVTEAAVKAGANQVYGPTFSISNQNALYKSALDDAFADAKSKAEAIAQTTGVTLGRVVNVVEGGQSFMPYPEASDAAGAAAPPIEPGLQEIQANLTVTFAIS
jgi:uncharacterized protein YggE